MANGYHAVIDATAQKGIKMRAFTRRPGCRYEMRSRQPITSRVIRTIEITKIFNIIHLLKKIN